MIRFGTIKDLFFEHYLDKERIGWDKIFLHIRGLNALNLKGC